MENKNNLPTLADLHQDLDRAFENDQLNWLLNQPIPKSFLMKHPMTGLEYLPVEKVEFMLTRIFQLWRREVISIEPMFQSVVAHVRLHYKHPISGEWLYHDGVGAVGVQTDKGESAANLTAIKFDAVQKAAPAAVSYALKDAADNLGILFGKDLNRKSSTEFAGAYMQPDPKPKAPASPTLTDDLPF